MSFCPCCCGAPATADGQLKTQTPDVVAKQLRHCSRWPSSQPTESLRSVAVERTIERRYTAYEALHNRSTNPYENWQPDRARNRPLSGHNPISLACLGRDRTRHQFCIAVMCKRDICLAQLSAKTQPERTRQTLLPVFRICRKVWKIQQR